jgi:hypothetical protein
MGVMTGSEGCGVQQSADQARLSSEAHWRSALRWARRCGCKAMTLPRCPSPGGRNSEAIVRQSALQRTGTNR